MFWSSGITIDYFQVQGDTGIKLQYTHCRLNSLEKNSGATPAKECIPEILIEPEVLILLKELAKFHDVLYQANEQLEAYILVNYLFHLWLVSFNFFTIFSYTNCVLGAMATSCSLFPSVH